MRSQRLKHLASVAASNVDKKFVHRVIRDEVLSSARVLYAACPHPHEESSAVMPVAVSDVLRDRFWTSDTWALSKIGGHLRHDRPAGHPEGTP